VVPDDSLEGKMAGDTLKNKKMLDKSTNFRSKSFFWCSRSKSVVVADVLNACTLYLGLLYLPRDMIHNTQSLGYFM
jgi:hypothetical protein